MSREQRDLWKQRAHEKYMDDKKNVPIIYTLIWPQPDAAAYFQRGTEENDSMEGSSGQGAGSDGQKQALSDAGMHNLLSLFHLPCVKHSPGVIVS